MDDRGTDATGTPRNQCHACGHDGSFPVMVRSSYARAGDRGSLGESWCNLLRYFATSPARPSGDSAVLGARPSGDSAVPGARPSGRRGLPRTWSGAFKPAVLPV